MQRKKVRFSTEASRTLPKRGTTRAKSQNRNDNEYYNSHYGDIGRSSTRKSQFITHHVQIPVNQSRAMNSHRIINMNRNTRRYK